jgi:hypothetical protein
LRLPRMRGIGRARVDIDDPFRDRREAGLKMAWILHQKFEVPRWPWRIKAIVLVCESTTITNGVRDSGTGPARFPVRG